MVNPKNAILLCSGGLDSVTAGFYAKKMLKYSQLKVVFFDYGQRALQKEKLCSRICARKMDAEFIEIKLEWLGKISNSLINKSGKIKKISRKDLKNTEKESRKYYVPCRNMIFISYALALADSLWIKNKEKYDIILGFKCEGKESYPDTTREFVEQMNNLARIGYSTKNKVLAPLIERDKEDIIVLGKKLGVDLNKTFSCYSPVKRKHCGSCLACRLRKEGFYWANMPDPTDYFEND